MPTCIGNYKIKIIDPAEHPIFNPNAACINVWYDNDEPVWYIEYHPIKRPAAPREGPKNDGLQ